MVNIKSVIKNNVAPGPKTGTDSNLFLVKVDGDPSVSGCECAPGTIAVYNDGLTANLFLKTGSSDMDWVSVPKITDITSGLENWTEDGTGNLTPNSTEAQVLGSDYNRINSITSNQMVLVTGPTAPVIDPGKASIAMGVHYGGDGTETITVSGGYYDKAGDGTIASGYVKADNATGTAYLATIGNGAMAMGSVRSFGAGSEGYIKAGYNGYAGGYIAMGSVETYNGGYSKIHSYVPGSMAMGRILNNGGNAKIQSYSYGSLSVGFLDNIGAGETALIQSEKGSISHGEVKAATGTISSNNGSFSGGYIATGATNGNISAGSGGFAHGKVGANGGIISATFGGAFVIGGVDGATAILSATGSGAFAAGSASGSGKVQSQASGSFASGNAINDGLVKASGLGTFASGYSNSAANEIVATGKGSQQFGIGNNTVDATTCIGESIRLHHTNGLPGALGDGDVWRDGTDLSFRSAGATHIFSQPTITGSRAANAALADLLTELAAMGLIVDSTSA